MTKVSRELSLTVLTKHRGYLRHNCLRADHTALGEEPGSQKPQL